MRESIVGFGQIGKCIRRDQLRRQSRAVQDAADRQVTLLMHRQPLRIASWRPLSPLP